MMKNTSWLLCLLLLMSCNQDNKKNKADLDGTGTGTNKVTKVQDTSRTYSADRDFLKHNYGIVELTNGESKLVIVPKFQGRVMTSTCQGDSGYSFGWINYSLISSHKYMSHINAYGGEERFWMGPEGGQYSLFFKKGDPFDLKHWQTPAIIDTVTFNLIKKTGNDAIFSKSFQISNYSGMEFHVQVERDISLLNQQSAETILGLQFPQVKWVAYESVNSIKNIGEKDWNKSSGILSIWLLTMMKASPDETVIIPYKKGGENMVNDSYFGKVPSSRLRKTDSMLFFKTDGKYRSKIGIPPSIVKPLVGSYDSVRNILTIMKVEYKGDLDYVNSMWEHQKYPYKGDVVNAYNDGPNDMGTQLGAFYEIETSSPAVALKKGEALTHVKIVFHFQGAKAELNKISKKLLGVELSKVK